MQLNKWFALALVAVMLEVATPIILLTTSTAAATTAALTLTVANPALAAVGGAAVLLGAAGLIAAAASNRGKRSVADVADDGFSVDAVDILFAAAGSLDTSTNCGLRLVCELAATPEDQLAADEALIMSLFGNQVALHHDQVNSPVTPFQLAVFLGRQSGSAQACANTYQKCTMNSNQIMDVLRQNQVTV